MTILWITLGVLAAVAVAVVGFALLIELLFPDSVERYPSGKVKSRGQRYHGDKQGLWLFYYENGQIEAAGDYVAGFECGPWNFCHPDGRLRARGEIDEGGYKKGEWEYWDEAGQPLSEGEFRARYPEDGLAEWPPPRA